MPDERRTPLQATRRLIQRTRSRGTREVVRLAWGRLKENLRSDETLIFFARSPEPEEEPVSPALHGRPATPGDAGRYALDIGTDSPVTFQDRLAEDVLCFVVEAEGRLLHASWITTSCAWTRELRGHVCAPAGDAYVYESFTRADARGRGVYPFALKAILPTMAARGVRRVWVAAETSNESSRKAIAKAGFAPIFTIGYRRSWGRLTIDPPGGPHPREAAAVLRLVGGRQH